MADGFYIPPVTAYDPLPVKPHADSTMGIEDEPPPSRAAGAVFNSPGGN
jgi:hypothetical protein